MKRCTSAATPVLRSIEDVQADAAALIDLRSMMTPDAFQARRDALDAEMATIGAASAVPTTAERLVDAGTLEQEFPQLDDDTKRAALRLFFCELRVRRFATRSSPASAASRSSSRTRRATRSSYLSRRFPRRRFRVRTERLTSAGRERASAVRVQERVGRLELERPGEQAGGGHAADERAVDLQ